MSFDTVCRRSVNVLNQRRNINSVVDGCLNSIGRSGRDAILSRFSFHKLSISGSGHYFKRISERKQEVRSNKKASLREAFSIQEQVTVEHKTAKGLTVTPNNGCLNYPLERR